MSKPGDNQHDESSFDETELTVCPTCNGEGKTACEDSDLFPELHRKPGGSQTQNTSGGSSDGKYSAKVIRVLGHDPSVPSAPGVSDSPETSAEKGAQPQEAGASGTADGWKQESNVSTGFLSTQWKK